jgi:hypothetical protein
MAAVDFDVLVDYLTDSHENVRQLRNDIYIDPETKVESKLDEDKKKLLLFEIHDNLEKLKKRSSEGQLALRQKYKFTRKQVEEFFDDEPESPDDKKTLELNLLADYLTDSSENIRQLKAKKYVDPETKVESPLDAEHEVLLVFEIHDNLEQLKKKCSKSQAGYRKEFKFTRKQVADYFEDDGDSPDEKEA